MLDAVLLKLHKWTLLVMRSSLQGGHNFDPIQEIGPNVGGGGGPFHEAANRNLPNLQWI